MILIDMAYIAAGLLASLTLLLFLRDSIRERKRRAIAITSIILLLFCGLWVLYYLSFADRTLMLAVPIAVLIGFVLLFFLPLGRSTTIRIGDVTERVDERDTMFAREEYTPGDGRYARYYSANPEKEEIDKRIRHQPELLAPGGKFFDPVHSTYTEAIFEVISGLVRDVDGEVAENREALSPQRATALVKELATKFGADEVGVCELNPAWVYSHVGRGPEDWGQPIDVSHRYAIAFTIEMEYDPVQSAPQVQITEETAVRYLEAAVISIALAAEIRKRGYPARAHVSGSNYQLMLPPVAYEAGLGELGRHGYLISKRFGSRFRLGAVTTDLALVPDRPINIGVQAFCEICRKCADNCPSGSIPKGEKTNVRGVEKWQLQIESCFRLWRIAGTDCGLCMKVCPFSHPQSLVHNLVRAGISRSSFARRIALRGDDLFYGRRVPFSKMPAN